MEAISRDFKGVWIPKEIWLSDELSLIGKCLLVEIDSLDKGEEHCYAGNAHFAKFLGCSDDTVSRGIKFLEKLGLITVERTITKQGTDRIMRVARPTNCGPAEPQNAGLLDIPVLVNTNISPKGEKGPAKKRGRKPRSTEGLKPRGEFKNVFLKQEEIDKLFKEYGQDQLEMIISKFSAKKEANGYEYKDDYAAIRNWVIDSVGAVKLPQKPNE